MTTSIGTTSGNGTGSTSGSAPLVSVASSSSAGAAGGSVINVSALVSELVAATQAPQEQLIENQTTAVTTEISSLATLQSALSTFQGSLGALDTPAGFGVQTATSSNPDAFTATATSGASPGSYGISISQLAQAQQLLSNTLSATGAIGTGTLALSLGGTSFGVTIDSSNDTLAGIAAAIDAAAGNPGITATVLQGTGGAYLLLSSSQTGAANTIQVSETDGGNALAALTYGTGNTANYTQQSAAQDASYSIAGVAATSASNTFANALGGVTLTLLGTTGTTPATLSVSNDTATIATNIQSLVSAYNALEGTFTTLGGYDSSTNTAGPMMGNALLTATQNQVRQALYQLVDTGSSTYNSLASIGITTNSDGTLSLNAATLSNALQTNSSAVSQLFSGAGGVASSLNSMLTSALSSTGSFAAQSQSLTSQENTLTQRNSQLSEQMAQLSASLTQQYSSLNTLLSSLQSTSAYLTEAFAGLPLVQGQPQA
jgi:flagellar hook-associated protein 2